MLHINLSRERLCEGTATVPDPVYLVLVRHTHNDLSPKHTSQIILLHRLALVHVTSPQGSLPHTPRFLPVEEPRAEHPHDPFLRHIGQELLHDNRKDERVDPRRSLPIGVGVDEVVVRRMGEVRCRGNAGM
jgi:hypothetical protein